MSLSFVSKSIQTTREDGGFEEKAIESTDANDDNNLYPRGDARPLFEQLQSNKEQAEAEREEFQRSIMRGTLTLDEEDCAHLDSLKKIKSEQEALRRQQTQNELEAFRAAKADLLESAATSVKQSIQTESLSGNEDTLSSFNVPVKSKPSAVIPQFKVKKRRRIEGSSAAGSEPVKALLDDQSDQPKPKQAEKKNDSDGSSGGIGGLLTGYGSSSDED